MKRTKGLSWRRGRKRGYYWDARTRWRGEERRERFYLGDFPSRAVVRKAAEVWLNEQDRSMGKPLTNTWVRSSGGWGRADKTGEWNRGSV